MKILSDHNIEGHAARLWDALVRAEWASLLSIEMLMFADVGLPIDSNDRVLWQFTQEHQLLLLTDNRNMKGEDSLEETIREENTLTSLPVLTVGNADRVMNEREYCDQCAMRIAEIIMEIEKYMGASRLFIP